MRPYPLNSPQAAARIISLIVIADGDVSQAEFDLLDRLAVHDQLGMDLDSLHEVFDDLCVDLLANQQLELSGPCPVDQVTLAGFMREIDDHGLRQHVLDMCMQLAEVDEHLAEGEAIVLSAALEHWGLVERQAQPALPCGRDTGADKGGACIARRRTT